MRKFLTALLVVTLLAATVLCCVGCKEKVEGSALELMDKLAADGKIVFEHSYNDQYQSETIVKVSVGDTTIQDDYTANSYLTYYANLDDKDYADYTVDPITFKGEKYYLTAVTLEKIPYSEGLKILFVQTVWSGDFSSSAVSKDKAILISLPNGAEATTLN